MTDSNNSLNDPLVDVTMFPPELSFLGYFQSVDKIGINGLALGFADGTEVNLLIVDIMGNSKSAIATIVGGSFEVSDIDASQFRPGDLTLTATAGNTLAQSSLLMEEILQGDPIVIDPQPELNGLNQLTILGRAPSLETNDVLTLEVRDSLDAKVTTTAVVQADGTFSVQNLSTQGLKEGVLIIDVMALTDNGAISVVNAASVMLSNMTPEGTDKTLQTTEDTALVVTAADLGYIASGGYTMTGVKIAGLPAQGTLKLNGLTVMVDQFVSLAQLDAGLLVFQPAANASGNNYASFKFKVMDDRMGNNADLVANTLTINVEAVNDAPVVSNLIPDQIAAVNAPFSYTIPANTFTDVDSTLTYSATLGSDAALPAWLTFNAATRTFSGTPPNANDFNLKVIASDGTNSVSDVFRVAIAPVVTSLAVVSATGALNERLNAGDVATIEVNFIEAVTVTGTPQLALNIGGTLVSANYVSGSGGTQLTFKYTVQAGQNDANGISIDPNALTLNGGTIQDVHGNNAILDTPAVADNASFKVDTENLRTVSPDGMDKNFSLADDTSDTWVVYSDGSTKGRNLYVTVAGTETLQQAQLRIDGGAWTNMTLSGNKAVHHFNTALTTGDHAFDFRTLDLAGNFSDITTKNVSVSTWGSLPNVTTVTTGTVTVPDASTGQALLGNSAIQTFTVSKEAIGSYLNNGADNLFLQGGSTGDAGAGAVADHLRMTGDGAVLNLTDLLNGGYTVDKIQGFEFLDMRAAGKQAIVADAISLGSVSTSGWLSNSNLLSGYYAMVVRGGTDDTLVINKGGAHDFTGFVADGTSTNAGNFIADGFTYDIYKNDTTKQYLLVQQGVQVSIWRPSAVGAPVNIVPLSVTALQDATKAITDISVEDINGNLSTVQLSVLNGSLSVSLSGTTVSAGALNSASVTLSGTQAQLNAALATLTYKGNAAFSGTDTLTIVSTDSTGTPLSDTDTVNITVTSSNTAPVPNPANGLVDNPLSEELATTLTITDNATGNAGNFVTSGTTVAQGLVRYTLTFSEAIDAASLTEADIKVSNGTLKGGSLVRVGTTNAWTVDVQSPTTGNGVTSVSILDGAYTSASGMAGQGGADTQAYGSFGTSPSGSARSSVNNNLLTADRATTYLPDGGWVTVAFTGGVGSLYNVNGFKFDATGSLVKQVILGTGSASSVLQFPTIVTLENGDLLMAYSTQNSPTGLVVQRLDAGLNKVGAAINPATDTANSKTTPAVTALPGGGYFVSWVSTLQDGSGDGIYGQIFDANSNKVGSEIRVNTTTLTSQKAPSVDAFSDGSFIATWSSNNASGPSATLNAQRFNANGTKNGTELTLATGDTPSDSVVRVLSNGSYVVAWRTTNPGGFGYFSKFQVYSASGTAIGSVVTLSGASTMAPSVAALTGGGFAVAWAEAATVSGYNDNVDVQVFDNSGTAVGTKFQSPVATAGEQNFVAPNLTALPNGGYALSYDTSGTAKTVHSQVFAAPGGSFLSGATAGGTDTLNGADSADVITANGGADIIYAGGGNDTVILNADNITKLAAANTMVIHGGMGVNTLKVDGAGSILDLTHASISAKLSHFSVIDLTGTGNNTLKINAQAVKLLSGASDNPLTNVSEDKLLVVNGNAGDALQLLDPQINGTSQWKVGPTDTGFDLLGNLGSSYGFVVGQSYTAYTLAGVTVYVNTTVTVTDFGTPTTATTPLVTEAMSVQSLFGTRFTDADGAGVANGQFKGVVITDAGTSTEQSDMGSYQWSTNGTTWTDFSADLSDNASVFLTPDTLIRFQAAPGVAELQAHDLSARLVDLSGATGTSALVNGQTGVNASVNGGSTAFSGTRVTLVQSSLPPADPVFSSASTATTPENVSTSAVVYDATANSDQGMVYSFVSGADASLFAINSSTGEVRFNDSPNFENKLDIGLNNVYDFTVRATNSAGVFADKAVALTVTNVNEYPVNNASSTLVATEDVSVAILGLSVSDEDGNVSTVKLTVLNGTLGVNLAGGAMVSAGANNTSTLTLSGTQAQINAALGTVTYKATANYNGSDTLTILSTDTVGLIDSNTMDITVNPANDAPVNTVPVGQSLNEDGSLVISGITVNDLDGNLSTVKLSVTTGAVGVTLSGGVTISAGANNSNSLTLSGTQADINTVLASLNYQAAPDFNGTATLTVLSSDSDGATDSDTVAINVISVNDAPVNTLPAQTPATEDGDKVITGLIVSDVDGNPNLTVTLVITNGTLTLLTGAGVTLAGNNSTSVTLTGTLNAINTLLATANAVTYKPTPNYSGSAQLTMTSSDGTLSDSDIVLITVNSVNDAPTGASTSITVLEDGSRTLTAADFGFADAFDTPANSLSAVIITALPTAGTLTLSGTPVTLNQNIPVASLGSLVYAPAANANGSGYASIDFKVVDNGGTANGGQNTSLFANTLTFNVTAVNDAPVLADTNLSTLASSSGAAPVGAVGSLVSSFMGAVTDPDGVSVPKGIAITAVDTTKGKLYYSTNGGTVWTEVTQTLSTSNALLLGSDSDNRVYFRANVDQTVGSSNLFTVRAWDQTQGSEATLFNITATGGSTAFSTATDAVALQITDEMPPVLVGSNPSDNGFMMAVGNNIVLNFNESVAKGTGLIELFTADGTLVQSFNAATSPLLTGWGTANLILNPTNNLLAGTSYYLRIGTAAIKDLAGNSYAGITDNTTLNFTTVDADGAIAVAENGIMSVEDLSTIGDFNGDGYDDFIIGAGINGLSSTQGAAYVVYGNANGTVPNLSAGSMAASAGFKIVSGQTGDYFGIAVNSAGDTNGDGLADLVVTAKYGDASSRESAYVVFGNSNASSVFATGLNVGTGMGSNGYQIKINESYWGHAVSNAGDVNGDGLSDLLVTSDFSGSRNVYVIYGKTGNQAITMTSYTQFTPDLGYNVLSGSVTDLGQSVYGAGDVNGDGLADFIVGAPNNTTGQRGMVYVVYGNNTGTSVQLNATNGIAPSQGFRIHGQTGNNTSYSYFGFAVSSAGDVNGDGLADVMISSPHQPGTAGGAVYVVYGNSSGNVLDMDLESSSGAIAASRGFQISSAVATDILGRNSKDIASAGDINGDGLSDLIIGGRDENGYSTASTYVVYGNASGTNVAIDASGNIAASNGFKLKGAVGFVVASAGDINGDGLNDLLVSARLGGNSSSYNVVLGGTQWVTAALDGAGTFAGTTASEALIGSAGNDTITGGGGVDRFFAGRGDDTIVLTASDITNLQDNSTGQTAKTTVSAGTGFDTIRLSGGANLDFLKISNAAAMGIDEASRIEGIERIDMATDTAANVLRISNKDVNDMSGFNQIHTGSASEDGKTWTNVSGNALSSITRYHQMVVDGGSNDTMALTANGGEWANVGTVSNGSANYTVYQNDATHSQVLVQQGVTVDTQAPSLLWSTPADNDYVNTANLGNNITLQFSENVVKGNGFIQLWNKTTGQPVQAFDVSSSTLVTGWGTSTLTINPTANLAAATDYFIKISDNAIQDSAGLAYSGMNSDLQLNFSTQSADNSYAVPSSFTSASSTSSYLRSVGTAGDFNGDGYDDLLVGVAGSTQSGVYVIYGNALGEGLNLDKDPVMSNGVIAADQGFKIQGTDYFGTSVSGIGDVNGDGFADVLIGASSDSQAGANAGAAFVVYGSADPAALNLSSATINASRGFKITAGSAYGTLGDSVAGVGDVNGDGIGDFVVGYAGANFTSGGGAAYVVYGKTNATSLTFGTNGSIAAADGFRLTGAANENAGFSVSGAGDVNGDGLADVIVSANGGLSNADGGAYVIFGGATGGNLGALVSAGKGFKITGLTNSTGHHLGTSVASAGDVNGDGYADLIVGTDADQNYTAAFVVYGGSSPTSVSMAASTIAAAQGFRILGNTANGAGLSQVSGAGDLNGDGFADVMVGSSNGSSYVVYGKATGAEVSVSTGTIAASQGFKLTYSTNTTSTTAQDVSFAGDFDGDGLNDLVIAEDTDFGNSQSYKIVFGGTQWLTTPVIGNGAVTGTAASEAILGSTANDTLTGGGGVDRFFAGMGNDTIVLTANDVSNLGNVAAGQTAKASVNGGGGFDTLRMSGGAALNLLAITNAGAMALVENSRIESIERIDLATDATANALTLSARDVKDMAGFNLFHTGSASADGKTWTNVSGTALSASTPFHQLQVDGGSTDSLVLNTDTGVWSNAGTVNNGTTHYTVYQNTATNTQVLVQTGMAVSLPPVLLNSNPSDNGYMMAPGNNITLSFDQVVQQGTGTIGIYKSADNTLLETAYDVASSGLVTGWGTNTLTINPTANLTASTGYYVKVSNTAVKNAAGATFTGINDATTLNFSTAAADGSVAAGTSYVGASGSNLGFTVSGAGDVNRDGFGDYIVGAHETHSAFVAYGDASGLGVDLAGGTIAASKGFKISGGYSTGYSVSGVGDVNGDGYDDVLVGMNSSTFVPTAYVVYGNSIGTNVSIYPSNEIPSSLGFIISGAAGSYVGYSVSGAGDVNGDGLADLVVGSPGSGGVPVMYVVYGRSGSAAVNLSSATIAASDGFKVTSSVNSGFGSMVSGAGDVNGDGLADVIVGSNIIGSAYVIYGNSTGTAVDITSYSIAAGSGFKIEKAQGANSFGLSVSGAGDVNGDGLADVVVGDRVNNSVYVVYGHTTGATVNINSTGGIAASSGFRIAGTSDSLGFTTSAVGDVNGDGLADVLVGPVQNVGYAYVVYGNASGTTVNISSDGSINASNGFKVTGFSSGYFAYSLSGAGDINGDGLSDLIMGSLNNGYSLILGGTQWLSSAVTGGGTVMGGTGAEAIIGSAAADTLTGGGGVDRFFAAQGNDTIVLTASDVSNLANNATGQTAKATVHGGGGFDTLRVTAAGLNLDLTAISNAGAMGLEENSRIESIERIDLGSDAVANTLTISSTDVKDMAGFNLFYTGRPSADGKTWTNVSGQALKATTNFHQMLVDGSSSDTLALISPVGPWRVEGTVSDGTNQYTVYQNANMSSQVLVMSGVTVQSMGGPSLLSSTPVDNGYMMALGDSITVSFDEAVFKGAGTIQLWNSSTGTLVQSFDVATSTEVTGWAGNTLTINPTANLAGATHYYLTISATAVKNAAGGLFEGVNNRTDVNFTTASSTGSIEMPIFAGESSSYLGMSLAEVGDFNGDGYDDVILGARGTGNYYGAAYVVYGNATGTLPNLSSGTIAASAGFKITGGSNSELGHSVSGLGDINGDGLMDVMVGTRRYTSTSTTNNVAHVVYGSTNAKDISLASGTIATSLGFTLKGGVGGSAVFFGEHVSNAGDVNGDGVADLIVSRNSSDSTGTGQVYVVYGKTGSTGFDFSGQTIASTDGYRITGSSNANGFADTLSGGADVNGDGLADMIVSAPNEQNTAPATGAAYVIFGNSTGTSYQISGTTIPSTMGFKITTDAHSGLSSVDMVGDVNGDGLADVIVGTFTAGTNYNFGAAYVVYGKSSGTEVALSNVATSPSLGFKIAANTSEYLGMQVSGAGDVNGDGLMDLMVSGGGGFTNAVYVIYGSANGSNLTVGTTGTSIASSRGFLITGYVGNSVSAAGDINGDGLDDLIMGGPSNVSAGGYSVMLGGTQWVTSVVKGEGTVTGGATAEALVGSTGDDTLSGGGGVDRFFAGMGDDTIVLSSSDVTNLANNATGQTAKAFVEGGNGFDTIRMSGGANLDLTSITNSGVMGLKENSRIESIERIDLATDTAANTLTLTALDVKDMAGFNVIHTGTASEDGNVWSNTSGTALSATTRYHQLVVNGTSIDTVVFAPDTGFWTNVGTVSNGTSQFTVYQNAGNNTQVLVQSGVVVTNNDSVAPVVLDLNRDGDLSYSQTWMDVNNDGQLDQTAWAGAQDGVLVWDKYADGAVHDNSQYAFAQYAGFAGATDLQGLAQAFDSHADGLLSNLDALYSQFAVWQDLDQDGMSDEGEVRSLADWGIDSIHLISDGVVQAPAIGVQEAGRSTAQLADGGEMVVADAAFAYQSVPELDLAGFVANAAATKAQPLPTQTSVKLFLYDMIQGVTSADQGSGGHFASEGDALAGPAPQPLGYHMDLLAEHLLQPPQS